MPLYTTLCRLVGPVGQDQGNSSTGRHSSSDSPIGQLQVRRGTQGIGGSQEAAEA